MEEFILMEAKRLCEKYGVKSIDEVLKTQDQIIKKYYMNYKTIHAEKHANP